MSDSQEQLLLSEGVCRELRIVCPSEGQDSRNKLILSWCIYTLYSDMEELVDGHIYQVLYACDTVGYLAWHINVYTGQSNKMYNVYYIAMLYVHFSYIIMIIGD